MSCSSESVFVLETRKCFNCTSCAEGSQGTVTFQVGDCPRAEIETGQAAGARSRSLRIRRIENTLDVFIQHGVELSIGLLGREPFDERARETRDETVISAQTVVGLFPRVPPR